MAASCIKMKAQSHRCATFLKRFLIFFLSDHHLDVTTTLAYSVSKLNLLPNPTSLGFPKCLTTLESLQICHSALTPVTKFHYHPFYTHFHYFYHFFPQTIQQHLNQCIHFSLFSHKAVKFIKTALIMFLHSLFLIFTEGCYGMTLQPTDPPGQSSPLSLKTFHWSLTVDRLKSEFFIQGLLSVVPTFLSKIPLY